MWDPNSGPYLGGQGRGMQGPNVDTDEVRQTPGMGYDPRMQGLGWTLPNMRGAENWGFAPIRRAMLDFGLGTFLPGGAFDPVNSLMRARQLGMFDTSGVGASYAMPYVNQLRSTLASQAAAGQGSMFNQALNRGNVNMAALPQLMSQVQAQRDISPYLAQMYGQATGMGADALQAARQGQLGFYGQGIQNMFGTGMAGLEAYMQYILNKSTNKSNESQSKNAAWGQLGSGVGSAVGSFAGAGGFGGGKKAGS